MKYVPLKIILLGTLALTSLALAAANYSVIVNGQVAPEQAIVVGGKTYVPLSALKLLGVNTTLRGTTLTLGGATTAATPGGVNQRASLEGCLNETLFNGVWRLTVKTLRPISRYNGQQSGYSLSLEWKNGTAKTIDALNSGVKNISLVLADGNTLTADNDQDLKYKTLPQAAGITLALLFYATSAQTAAGLPAPSKLLVDIDPSRLNDLAQGVAYSTPTPSFRVKLDCQK
ncbi:hypothetical protein [Deinococcus sp.]|uniref:hypothetical protein n=1 Tax=Deinococcus sp. TaxID=47478 RepID=UPI003CC61651